MVFKFAIVMSSLGNRTQLSAGAEKGYDSITLYASPNLLLLVTEAENWNE